MIRCDQVQLELEAYLRGKMSPENRAAIAEHLARCEACSEEAAAMEEIGQVLSSGLKDWVNQGTCPPEVMAQIERSIRSARKKPWWNRWPAYVGVAAAAAVLLVAVLASRTDFSPGQLASLPLVGSLAAQLLYVDTGDLPELKDARFVTVDASTEQNGAVLTVHRIATSQHGTRIEYTLRGGGFGKDLFAPQLVGPQGEIPFKQVSVRMEGGEAFITADFGPVPADSDLTLSVADLNVTFSH